MAAVRVAGFTAAASIIGLPHAVGLGAVVMDGDPKVAAAGEVVPELVVNEALLLGSNGVAKDILEEEGATGATGVGADSL
jgi:hypothetical protein